MYPAETLSGHITDCPACSDAEYICIDARCCHKIEDYVTFREAALGEPLAVAVPAVTERTTVHAGDLVLATGPGWKARA